MNSYKSIETIINEPGTSQLQGKPDTNKLRPKENKPKPNQIKECNIDSLINEL